MKARGVITIGSGRRRRSVLGALMLGAAAGTSVPWERALGQRPLRESHDSAGVRITQFRIPRTIPMWVLDTIPVFDIGGQADPRYQLSEMWRISATGLPDGRIVVSDQEEAEVRLFDSAGQFVKVVGGKGQGPGEFAYGAWAAPYRGDSILAWDGLLARHVSVFDREGNLGRAFMMRPPPLENGGQPSGAGYPASSIRGALSDGTIVGQGGEYLPLEAKAGLVWGRFSIRYYGADGTFRAAISDLNGIEFIAIDGAGQSDFEQPHFYRGPAWVAVFKDSVIVAHSEWLGFRIYDRQGKLVRVVRSFDPPSSPTAAERKAYLEMAVERAGVAKIERGSASDVAERIAKRGFAPRKPAFEDAIVDVSGNVWFGDFSRSRISTARTWTIVSPNGTVVGQLKTPAGADLLWIGRDRLLLSTKDADDVAHIRMMRFRSKGVVASQKN